MKKRIVFALALLGASAIAQASDRRVTLPIESAMNTTDAKFRLGESVKFYFGKQKTPAVAKRLGGGETSQKTNAFAKSDATACNWVFLSAMLQLQKDALAAGANAVVNIVSNYNNVEFSSDTQFECHAGAVVAGVVLKGDFVKFSD